jgi:hypothetical protein
MARRFNARRYWANKPSCIRCGLRKPRRGTVCYMCRHKASPATAKVSAPLFDSKPATVSTPQASVPATPSPVAPTATPQPFSWRWIGAGLAAAIAFIYAIQGSGTSTQPPKRPARQAQTAHYQPAPTRSLPRAADAPTAPSQPRVAPTVYTPTSYSPTAQTPVAQAPVVQQVPTWTPTTTTTTRTDRYYDVNYRPPVGEHYVKGYYRKNGTYVSGHYRTNRDNSFWNNYSSKGNVNPHTGKVGTRRPPAYRAPSYRSSRR